MTSAELTPLQEDAIEVYPVVHVNDTEQALAMSALAFEEGADGVYLINHGGMDRWQLLGVFEEVSRAHEGAYIGVNLLDVGDGVSAFKALQAARADGVISRYPDGVWSDYSLSIHGGDLEARLLAEMREKDPELKDVEYLGGVAFKYTMTHTEDPEQAAREVELHSAGIDVVTTSGPGTNQPTNQEKVRAMKEAANGRALAVASGVSAANIHLLKGAADKVLVASSVETKPYSGEFVPGAIRELVRQAHSEA